uniref:Uncharacterized protein n=1 Tax=Hyaloperonospora arabidopsidis (strain Emoy2) TaxID=559515 RepID=M4BWY6_HYAAE
MQQRRYRIQPSQTYQLDQVLPADAPPCTYAFTKFMGIPCAHAIKQKSASKEQVRVSDFRSHWWLQQASFKISNTLPSDNSLGNVLANISEKHQNLAPHQRHIFRKMVFDVVEKDGVECVANPQVIRTHGCPEGSVNRKTDNTTGRDPSAFEYVDGKVPPPGKKRCSICRSFAHNKRRCTENAGFKEAKR